MVEKIELEILGQKRTYEAGISYAEIAEEYQPQFQEDILLVMQGNRLCELHKKAKKSGVLHFITASDPAGKKTYRRSVTLMMQKALYNLLGKEKSKLLVLNCVSQGYYCELPEYGKPSGTFLADLKVEMLRLSEEKIPLMKKSITTDEAIELFHDLGMTDKEKLFRYRRSSKVNIYDLDGYQDYFYGYMVKDTGCLKYFDLAAYGNGFVLLFPGDDSRIVAPLNVYEKLYDTLTKAKNWGSTMGVGTVGALNDAIASGRMQELIRIQEALMEQSIGQLANQIAASSNTKFVMIAGPSSSGKTTFSHRLSTQLSAQGLHPHPLSLDNYYIDRQFCPRDEEGNYDFECLEALDVEKFNEDMTVLLKGGTINVPIFNFKTGKREYKDHSLSLGENDVLVIEGIHGLNPKLSYSLPDECKFKIFISALTQINIDEHNYMPTTDGRLIRRIVRDARTRNTTAEETIAMWKSVRRGEEKYIFPYQDSADVMFNSGLIYEMAVLKAYAEPLLFHIDRNSTEYTEAKRLLKFLDYFLPVPSEDIGKNSIIREFIGGSCFQV